MRFTLSAACALVLGLSCATLSPAEQSGPLAPSEPPRLEVELTIPRTGPVTVRLRVPREYLPAAAARVTFEFSRLPGPAQRGAVHGLPESVTASGEADLVLEYTVDIGPLGSNPDVDRLTPAFDLPRGRNLPLWALVPSLRGEVTSGRLYPISVKVSSPLPVVTSLEGGGGQFRAAVPDELFSGLLLAGPVTEVKCLDGLRLVSFDFDAPRLRRLAALEDAAALSLGLATGPRRPLKLLALHRLPPGASSDGIRGMNAGLVAFVLATMLDGDPTAVDERTFLHELTHSSLPTGGDEMPLWISEGFTEYFALQLALSIGQWPEETLREQVSAAWDNFAIQSPTLRAGATRSSSYSGGVVLAHCIDVRLRREGSSLVAVLKKVRARGKGTMTNDLYEEEIALASAAAGARIVSARREPLDPVAECFAEEAYERRPPVKGVPEWYLRDSLGIASIDVTASHTGVIVRAVDPKSKLQAEDRLVSFEGVRLVDAAHLKELLGGRREKFRAHFEIVREGVHSALEVELPGVADGQAGLVDRAVWLPRGTR